MVFYRPATVSWCTKKLRKCLNEIYFVICGVQNLHYNRKNKLGYSTSYKSFEQKIVNIYLS